MKFSITALAFVATSVLAGKGPKDHEKAPIVTVYATETTHKYGRFNKTPHPTTTTVVISPSEYSELAGKSASSILVKRDDVDLYKRANGTAAGGASNGTAAGGASNGTAAGGAGGKNSTGGGSSANAGNVASGATFAVAGAVAAGVALLI